MSWLNECESIETLADRQAKEEKALVNQFKRDRAESIANAIVTTQSGKQFDADEQSIGRMGFRIQRCELSGETSVGWVLADSAPGEKTQVSVDELREAFALAVDNMDENWGSPDAE